MTVGRINNGERLWKEYETQYATFEKAMSKPRSGFSNQEQEQTVDGTTLPFHGFIGTGRLKETGLSTDFVTW